MQLELRPNSSSASEPGSGRKLGAYKWFEMQDTVAYFEGFEVPKIFWPDISKLPRFSWNESGKYITTTGYVVPSSDPALLGILQSRVLWFAVSQICQLLRLRAGLWQYRVKPQYVSRLPIPDMDEADPGTPGKRLNQKLTSWWTLDFPSFRAEIKKVFKRDIPLRDRDDLEAWLDDRRAEHDCYTAEIVRLETELNARVYALFDLSPTEIQTIEEITKYRYGEV
jgi:hypothetical protein